MSYKTRRGGKGKIKRKRANKPAPTKLSLENLEPRVLLDVAGWWDELGWRSATGGGISNDPFDAENIVRDPAFEYFSGETQLIQSSDGDPIAIWVEGVFNEYVESPIAYSFEVSGNIYAKQYSDTLGWWDLSSGSGDNYTPGDTDTYLKPINFNEYFGDEALAVKAACDAMGIPCDDPGDPPNLRGGLNATQLDAAAGPNGEVVLVWTAEAVPIELPTDDRQGPDSEIYAKMWNGTAWVEMADSARGGGVSDDGVVVNENPSVAISASGEVFVSYTALHPDTGQREIVVKRFGYDYEDRPTGAPQETDLAWVELSNEGVGLFGESSYSGVSADPATSMDSAIAVDHQGQPIVVWASELSASNIDIELKRWDGDSWEEYGYGSASDRDGDTHSGVSNDAGISIQPDIAMADNGDIVVSWVNWGNWNRYDTDGEAGIFVRVLYAGVNQATDAWTEYVPGSAGDANGEGPGIAPSLGWYYSPQIDTTSNNNPLIAWQGFGAGERYIIDRDNSGTFSDPATFTPGLPGNAHRESPIMGVYASYYNGATFSLLADSNDPDLERASLYNIQWNIDSMSWMPDVLVGANDELIIGYTWRDAWVDITYQDSEIFVQQWDINQSDWSEFGRGSNSNGNDAFGWWHNAAASSDVKLGLIDYDLSADEPDVLLADGQHVYRYSRSTATWTPISEITGTTQMDPPGGYGPIFDLRGEPEYEFEVAGPPLLAYLSGTGVPYVLQWVGGNWSVVGGGPADTLTGNITGNTGIGVQAGPSNTILVAYVRNNGSTDDIIARIWNGSSWANADTNGVVPKDSLFEAAYYSNFDGFDWDVYGELSDGDFDSDNNRVYNLWEWNFWDITDYNIDPVNSIDALAGALLDVDATEYASADFVSASAADDAGFPWVDSAGIHDTGLLAEFVIEEDDPAGRVASVVEAEIDHLFQLIDDGDIIVELMHSITTTNMEVELYLTVDGTIVDTISTLGVGLTQPYSQETTYTFDYKPYRLANSLTQLSDGPHTVGIWAKSTVVGPDLLFTFPGSPTPPPAPDLEGWVYSETTGVGGGDPGGTSVTGTTDAGADVEDNYDVADLTTHIDDNISGGLEIVFTDNINTGAGGVFDEDLFGGFEYEFILGGDATIDFDYRLMTNEDLSVARHAASGLSGQSRLFIKVLVDGVAWTSSTDPGDNEEASDDRPYIGIDVPDPTVEQDDSDPPVDILTGVPGDSGWTSATTIALEGEDSLAPGTHTLRIEAYLEHVLDGNLAGKAVVLLDNIIIDAEQSADVGIDNFSVYQRIVPQNSGGTTYDTIDFAAAPGALPAAVDPPGNNIMLDFVADAEDGAETTAAYNAAAGPAGNTSGAMEITLGNGTDATVDLEGQLTFTFTPAVSGFLDVNLSYFLATGQSIAAGETLDLVLTLDDGIIQTNLNNQSVHRLTADGTSLDSVTWQSYGLHNTTVPVAITSGTAYTLQVRGLLSSDAVGAPAASDGQGVLTIDDVVIGVNSSYGDWEFRPEFNDITTEWGDIGGNESVGRNADNTPVYTDFQADIHSHLDGAGTQSYIIEDLTQDEDGQMIALFRYRLTGGSVTMEVDNGATPIQFTAIEPRDLPLPLSYAGSTDWWNGDSTDPHYTYAAMIAEGVSAGARAVTITLTSTGSAEDLWIDNLVVFAAQPNNAIEPIATLLPTGSGGTRQFGIGATYESLTLRVYEDATDVYPDGTISDGQGLAEFDGGYYTANIQYLDPADSIWKTYGEDIDISVDVDFTGVGGIFPVASGGVYKLTDIAIGPNSYAWVALQHSTLDWVDADGDGTNEEAVIHPWNVSGPTYWHEPTDLDIEVLRWNPTNDPTDVAGGADERWIDTGFQRPAAIGFKAFTNGRLVSSGGQLPTVAWTERTDIGSTVNSDAQQWQRNGTWGLLSDPVASSLSIQNSTFWSSLTLSDMIVRPDGYPVVGFYAGHLFSNGVREFRTDDILPDMVLTEQSGIPNDNQLDFINVTNNVQDKSFNIANLGPGDLMVYDIEIAGLGSLPSGAFTLRNAPDFTAGPLTLEDLENRNIGVRFNPGNVAPGEYSAVLLVHSSDPDHPDHPYGHFHEIILYAEVITTADIEVDPLWLDFEDVNIGQTTKEDDRQEIIITNNGDEDLVISEWFFDGNNFAIDEAFVTEILPTSEVIKTQITTTDANGRIVNYAGDAGDDVTLEPDTFLTMLLVFAPDDVAIFNDTLYIHSNDSDSKYVAVALTANGTSGAGIEVRQGSDILSDEDILNFGSVIMDGTPGEIIITITNTGTNTLNISSIIETSNDPDIEITPPIESSSPFGLLADSQNTLTVTITFSPGLPVQTDPNDPILPEELETRILILSNDPNFPTFELNLTGWAVPLLPLIEVTENSGVANDDKIEFGNVGINQPVTQTFIIENTGGADLIIDSILVKEFLSPFEVINPIVSADPGQFITIEPNDSQIVTVKFNPADAGGIRGQLNIISNAENKSPYSLILEGNALDPQLNVTDSQGSANDGEIDFGFIGQGLSTSETITITNNGNTVLFVDSWSLTDPAGVFSIVPTFAGAIALNPGNTQDITVTFNPNAVAAFSGSVTIVSDNDTTNSPWIIDLSGDGVAPGEVTITDSEVSTVHGEINFTTTGSDPLIALYDSSVEFFTITNTGNSDLVIEGIELDSTAFRLDINGRRSLNPNVASDDIILTPGSNQIVLVTFAPNIKLAADQIVTITTSDPTGGALPPREVKLMGQSIFAGFVGTVDGAKQPKRLLTDENQQDVWVKVSGDGYAVVVLENGYFSGANIESITLVGTTEKSVLTVTGPREGTTIGRITGDTVKNVVLKNATLDGDGLSNPGIDIDTVTGMLCLGDLINGADIDVASTSGKGIKIKAGDIGDGSDVDIQGDVALFQASGFGAGTFQAASVNKFNIGTGDFDAVVTLEGDLNNAKLNGTSANGSFIVADNINRITANNTAFYGVINADDINKLTFGSFNNADVSVRGDLLNLTLGNNLQDSRILAGYDLGTDGRIGGTGSAADTLVAGGYLGKVNIRGRVDNSFISAGVAPNGSGNFLDPANLTAIGRVGQVSFGSAARINNGIIYGVSAATSIDKVLVGSDLFESGDSEGDFAVMLI